MTKKMHKNKVPTTRKKNKVTEEQRIKRNFRGTKDWKDFRLSFIKENNNSCSLCGVKKYGMQKKSLQLHHHDDSLKNYKNISDRSKFTLMCAGCHKKLENSLDRKDFNIDDWFIKFKSVYDKTMVYTVKNKKEK